MSVLLLVASFAGACLIVVGVAGMLRPHAFRKGKGYPRALFALLIGLGGLLFAARALVPDGGGKTELQVRAEEEAKAQARAIQEATCLKDANCLASRLLDKVSGPCSHEIERHSKFSFRWKDGPGESRFVKAAWEDEAAGQLAFIGDRIQFQNGFGAHQDMKYICSYDTKADRVISARVYEGRL